MKEQRKINVAVLLATYNGTRFIEPQLKSLMANFTPFTLHWLDDHSTDNTREVVRVAALRGGFELREWHQARRLGVPSAFFRLLECAEADIYLFCDQDDIWQPGKIDATVENLLPDIGSPVLCFSDSLLFTEAEPEKLRRLYKRNRNTGIPDDLRDSRMFYTAVPGHSEGFTRPLREIFLRNAAVAHSHAAMHDSWMYHIAMACGTARILPPDAPVALWRQHHDSFMDTLLGMDRWRFIQHARRVVSRHVQGFMLASTTLPQTPKLARALEIAQVIAKLNQRHSLAEVVRLLRRDVIAMDWRWRPWWITALLLSAVTPSDVKGA